MHVNALEEGAALCFAPCQSSYCLDLPRVWDVLTITTTICRYTVADASLHWVCSRGNLSPRSVSGWKLVTELSLADRVNIVNISTCLVRPYCLQESKSNVYN